MSSDNRLWGGRLTADIRRSLTPEAAVAARTGYGGTVASRSQRTLEPGFVLASAQTLCKIPGSMTVCHGAGEVLLPHGPADLRRGYRWCLAHSGELPCATRMGEHRSLPVS